MSGLHLIGDGPPSIVDQVRDLFSRAGRNVRWGYDAEAEAAIAAVDGADIEVGSDLCRQLQDACLSEDVALLFETVDNEIGHRCCAGVACDPNDVAELGHAYDVPCRACADADAPSTEAHERAHGPGLV